MKTLAVKFTRRYREEYRYTSQEYHYFWDGETPITTGMFVAVPVHDMKEENYAIAKVSAVYESDPSGLAVKHIIGPIDVEGWKERATRRIRREVLEAALEKRIAEINRQRTLVTMATLYSADPEVAAIAAQLKELG